ncbi:MAG TPA: DUF2079 domain-containing protein [Candidatus Baltobacteraceae bacterium]|nr:DUF2079 domain-containing protein [Candidatus Baltobacteraceae bacterium]
MKTLDVNMRTVCWAMTVFAVVYIALDLNKFYALRYGADMGTFLQTISNMRHGSSWNFGEWRPHLQVHDSWILFSFVPLIALFPRGETLIVAQVLIVAAAAIPLVLFAREIGVSPRTANVLAIAYLLSPSAQGFTYDNFSENVFVPLLAFSAALCARRRALWPALVCAQLLMGVKEDEILFVAWFAAACFAFWDRKLGAAIFGLAVANAAAFWGVERLIGGHSNAPGYAFAVEDIGGKLTLIALLLAPFAFTPLLVGRWLVLAIPLLAEIVFAQHNPYEPSRIGTHYTAPLLACSAIAAAFGVLRRPRWAAWMVPCALLVMLFIFNDTALRPGRWPFVVDWNAYARAIDVRNSRTDVLLPRGEEGVWAVAAINPHVRLEQNADPKFVACPGYNTNAAAFFSSIGIGPHRDFVLCGGVPVNR